MNALKLEIHEFDPSFGEDVIKIWKTTFNQDPPWNNPAEIIHRKNDVNDDLFLVGKLDGRVIATVIGGYDGFRGWIYHLAVMPVHQRKGIGSKMIHEIEQRLENRGCVKINLQIRSSNTGTIIFYRKLGYNIEDHISMGKLLKSGK